LPCSIPETSDVRDGQRTCDLHSHDLRRTGETIAQAARLPVDFIKALLNHNDKGATGIYARWHMFEEKREAVIAIEAAVLPLMPEMTR
jgi:integrase